MDRDRVAVDHVHVGGGERIAERRGTDQEEGGNEDDERSHSRGRARLERPGLKRSNSARAFSHHVKP
jgi:hypothetical protein